MDSWKTPLPYTDTKPQGAADFYFAINATFRFILRERGEEGFARWLTDLGRDYFAPVNADWRADGLPAVARYWRAFFAAEPGAEVAVQERPAEVEIAVRRCPAIAHLKRHRRRIVPEYCRHCAVLGGARAAAADLSMCVEGGNGACIHRYAAAGVLRQDPAALKEVR
ncbi:MAG: hypothetical protein K9N49_06690 [Candidatus Marinimicrobia bacterium]|nr:hypothetical protein [Candidatus Neomarinimicrobiota bacterium]